MRYVLVLVGLVACGDNRKRPPDAPLTPHEAATPGLPYVELPPVPDTNHASEVEVAAAGADVVVLTVAQRYPNADSFVPPATDDPVHPFRRLVYMTSHDHGYAWDPPQVLDQVSHGDPQIAASGDGSFWAAGILAFGSPGTDLYHSTDGGRSFTHVANVLIDDKEWIAVDDTRRAVWLAGAAQHFLVGFDGSILAQCQCGQQMSAAYADAVGGHFMDAGGFQGFVWDSVAPYVGEGQGLPHGDEAEDITFAAISMGLAADGGQWSVRAMKDSVLGGPIVVRVRHLPDEGSDLTISPPGTLGFLPVGALDARGRLHVAWYDSSGPKGQLLYAHSLTSDVQGAWSTPILVDGDACPGGGWYPSEKYTPEGERRLREYIGIATTGSRSIIAWTHAPEAPSRVRIAFVDD